MKENLSLIFCVILLGGFIFLFVQIRDIRMIKNIKIPETQNRAPSISQDVCGSDCKKQITDVVSQAIATLSAGTKTVIEIPNTTSVPVKKLTKTAYLPLAGPITTTSTDWVDAAGTDFYLDLAADYSPTATASWEAVLSLSNSSDQVYARLYDVTHATEVGGSAISLVNTTTPTRVASGNLSLWRGWNSYRVQFKSRNSSLVIVNSGQVKIIYYAKLN